MKRLTFALATMVGLAVAAVVTASLPAPPVGDRAVPEAKFRITAENVIVAEDELVARIEVEARPGATIRVTANAPDRGGLTAVTPAGPVRLTVFGDHVRWETGKVDALKFRMSLGGGVMSDAGPMPEGKSKLSAVLSVAAESGLYPEGDPVPVVTFKGVTYSLVVAR